MITVSKLSLSYQTQKALNDVSFSLDKGSFTTVVGPSGCGKSSLLLVLAGLIQPDSGTVMVNGEAVQGVSTKTAILLQDLGLFGWKTVQENIAFVLRDRGLSKKTAREAAISALVMVGMADYKDRYIATLSGGQKQRVGFAKALALKPDLILFDEATAALDAFSAEMVQDLLRDLHRQTAATILYVTHKIDEAVYLGESILVMREGQVLHQIQNDCLNRDDPEFFRRCLAVKEALK